MDYINVENQDKLKILNELLQVTERDKIFMTSDKFINYREIKQLDHIESIKNKMIEIEALNKDISELINYSPNMSNELYFMDNTQLSSMNNIEDFKYYVYEHYLDKELFYIGKGSGGRALEFTSRGKLWIDKVNGRENDVKVKIIAIFEDSDHAELFEKFHIKRSVELDSKLTNITHNKYNNLGTHPNVLKRIKLKKLIEEDSYEANSTRTITHYAQIENIISECREKFEDLGYKGIIYSETIKSMKNIEEILIKEGYNPLVIWAAKNSNNDMDARQWEARLELINTGKIPKPYDFLVFNSHIFTEVCLKDEHVELIVVNSSSQEMQQYIKNFVRRDVDLLVYRTKDRKAKISIEMSEKYLDKPLTTVMKKEMCEALNVIGNNGMPIKWAGMKKRLIENKYTIRETQIRIDGKPTKVSIITK